jgi:hypothetical protein
MARGLAILAVLATFSLLPGAAATAAGLTPAQQRAERALQRVKDLKAGIGVHTGRELTPALMELARTKDDLTAAGRKEAQAIFARPTDGNSDPQGDGYTVDAEPPFCTTNFCFHWVTTTADAPPLADADSDGVPNYVEQMAGVFENDVFPCENGTALLGCANAAEAGLGWPAAPSDISSTNNGGNSKFDVYLKQLCADPSACLFGYVAPEQVVAPASFSSYLVLDNDFAQSEFGYPDSLLPTQVTAAHEYNHVLQFGIDANEDSWMFESTATWAEDKVYPADNDYLNYMNDWVQLLDQPITEFASDKPSTPTVREDLKVYGSAVWNHWLDARRGAGSILQAWQAKTVVQSGHTFAPASYNTAITANGGQSFADEFDDFAASVAEWRVPTQGFPDTYPDVPAVERPNMSVGAGGVSISLDHTTFAFRDIPVPGASTTLTLHATPPSGLKGAIALVGRTGNSTTSGTVSTAIQHFTSTGSEVTVALPNADTFGRITAVLVNADTTQTGFSNGQQDWNFSKDGQSFTGVRVTSGSAATAPAVTTDAASGVLGTSATLNGHVNPNGASTTYFFEYGTTQAYGNQVPVTPASAGSGSSSVAVSASASGLTANTTYHYRIVASNAGGTVQGNDQTFTTSDAPVVSTDSASAITKDGATLNATIDPRGLATTYVFEYGPTASYGNQVPALAASAGSGTGGVPVSQVLTGVTQGTTVHYRVVATNANGTTAGADRTFTTLDPPVVTTEAADGITATGAVLNGTIDTRDQRTSFKFELGTTTAYGIEVTGDAGDFGVVSVGAQASGLDPGTVYHYRLVATSADGTTTGDDVTFTTASATGGTGSSTGTGSTGGTNTGDVNLTPRALTMTLAVVRAKLAAALKKGVRVRAGCGESCTVTVKLVLPAKLAKKLKLKPTVATARGNGDSTLRLRFTRKAARALKRVRTVTFKVTVTGTTPDGRKATVTKTLTLRR